MTSRKQSIMALHAEAMSCGSNNAYHAMESRSFAVNFWVASESIPASGDKSLQAKIHRGEFLGIDYPADPS